MKNQKVTSREYKIMLNPEKFKGDEDKLQKKAQQFWDLFSKAIADTVKITGNKLNQEEKRLVRFYDTKDHMLYKKHDYVFRERTDTDKKEREVTLKFRHRDRYIAQARDMNDQDGNDKDLKFEEDIKPLIFVSLYSFSNKLKIKKSKNLNKLDDPGRLFPDLPKRLGKAYDGNKKIDVVNGFTAYQIVLEGASFQIDDDAKLQCKCALIVWYDKKFTGKPLLGEFSFKYKDESEKEHFSAKAAQKAFKVFQILQENKKLKDWVDPEGTTKTKFAYEYSGKS